MPRSNLDWDEGYGWTDWGGEGQSHTDEEFPCAGATGLGASRSPSYPDGEGYAHDLQVSELGAGNTKGPGCGYWWSAIEHGNGQSGHEGWVT